MNILSEDVAIPGNGTKVVKYATTPVMSTYLVAFAVGELDYIEVRAATKRSGFSNNHFSQSALS
jgi:aminopeptidase 2